MTAHVKQGNAWREIRELHAKAGGQWREIETGWVKVNGTWRRFYAAASPFMLARTISSVGLVVKNQPASVYANVVLYSTGALGVSGQTHYPTVDPREWLASPGDPSEWWVRAWPVAGDEPDGVLGQWLSLTSSPLWSVNLTNSFGGSISSTFNFEFSRDGGSTVAYTSPVTTLQVSVTP